MAMRERLRRALRPAHAGPARAPRGGARRQINSWLGPGEHERLLRATQLLAMRPITLARLLTMRGVDRDLYGERRERARLERHARA